MNPEAEKLCRALANIDSIDDAERRWLAKKGKALVELVDAAIAWCSHAEEEAAERRLVRAVVTFKGPQGPPEPERREHTVLYCPEPGCTWWRAADVGPVENAYRSHHHDVHNPGRRE